MATSDDWTALSARIHGLIEASHLAAELLAPTNDSIGAMVQLGKHAVSVVSDLAQFGTALGEPERSARLAIEQFTAKAEPLLKENDARTTEMRQIYIRSALVMLAAVEAEISYLLVDRQLAIRSRTERAFEHLQRLIVVDDSVRQKWQHAFEANEPECEKLGAAHLLGHGIWAFKVNALGARTDLVYQEPLTDTNLVKRAADGLVLTEWKKLPLGGSATTFFENARKQAAGYVAGVLAGTELTRYRYAILVSKTEVKAPDDLETHGATYRHINIAVEPRTPSKR